MQFKDEQMFEFAEALEVEIGSYEPQVDVETTEVVETTGCCEIRALPAAPITPTGGGHPSAKPPPRWPHVNPTPTLHDF